MPLIENKLFADNILPHCRIGRTAIFGSGETGKAVIDLLRKADVEIIMVADDYAQPGSSISGIPVLPSSQLTDHKIDIVILATLKARERMTRRLKEIQYQGKILSLPGEDSDVFMPQSGANIKEIAAFKDRHRDEPAFILGNGASLSSTDPKRIKNALTFGCNAIFLMKDFAPDYYCVEDVLVAEDRANTINRLPWTMFFPNDCRKWLTAGLFFNAFRVPEISRFSTDFAEGIEVNATVTYTMIQLAYYMGCNPVYLVGLDHSYEVNPAQANKDRNILLSTNDDPNHFHPDYFGKGFRWHDPRLDRMEAAYRLAREAYRKAGRLIYNATAGGNLEVFERISFDEALKNSQS